MDPAGSGGERRGDEWIASASLAENQRQLAAAYAEVIENRNKAAKGHSELAPSMKDATRTFAKAMRATLEESRRFAKEREQLLKRERAARAEAEAARERLREVLESVGDAFFAVDREWRLTYVNHRAEQYWGRQREELLGRNIWEEFPQMVGSEAYQAVQRAMAQRVVTEFEALSPVTNVWIAGRAYPSSDGVSVYLQDITERKLAQEEHERLLARELVAYAQAEERQRISRELHDRVAHSMGVVHQSLQLYEALLPRDPSQAEAKLALASEMAKKALDSTRNLAMALRDPITGSSLKDALLGFLESIVPPEIKTDLSVEGDESSVPVHVREQLFLILREALRNTVLHSDCRRISVRLDIIPEKVTGIVEDDGEGFSTEDPTWAPGTGLESMKERAALVGGVCSVQSELNEGTCIHVSIPLTQDR